MESAYKPIYHLLQDLLLSHVELGIYLSTYQLTGTITTEIVNINKLDKLMCTYCH